MEVDTTILLALKPAPWPTGRKRAQNCQRGWRPRQARRSPPGRHALQGRTQPSQARLSSGTFSITPKPISQIRKWSTERLRTCRVTQPGRWLSYRAANAAEPAHTARRPPWAPSSSSLRGPSLEPQGPPSSSSLRVHARAPAWHRVKAFPVPPPPVEEGTALTTSLRAPSGVSAAQRGSASALAALLCGDQLFLPESFLRPSRPSLRDAGCHGNRGMCAFAECRREGRPQHGTHTPPEAL